MYRIKFDGEYVKECDYEYLVECKKEESIFSEDVAQSIKKQCPERIELEKIDTKAFNEAIGYNPSLLDNLTIKESE